MLLKMLFFFAVCSFAAWILLFVGIGTIRDSRRRSEQERTRTAGTIVDYTRGEARTGKGHAYTFWRPVVEFTADGRKLRLEYANQMDQEKYPVGATVDILYDVSDPTRFHLESDPVFTDPGGGAIRIALIWILLSAALTVFLAVFVGGATFDFRHLWHDIRRSFS